MTERIQVSFAAVALLVALPLFAKERVSWNQLNWELASDADEPIQVWRAHFPDSQLVAFRARAEIPCRLPSVASVLFDLERQSEWMPNHGESKILRRISRFEYIIYQRIETPFIFSDRDLVLHVRLNHSEADGALSARLHSVSDIPEAAERDGFVRAWLNESRYFLVPLRSDDSKTQFEIFVHSDAKMALPAWLVNFFAVSFPRKLIEGLTEKCLSGEIPVRQDVEELHQRYLRRKLKRS